MVDIKNFRMYPGKGYVGLAELREQGFVYDTSHFYGSEKIKPHSEVLDKLDTKLQLHNEGMLILRTPDRERQTATNWKNFFQTKYSQEILDNKLEVIECHSENISDTLTEAEKISFFKNVILIVVGSLSMGYRLYDNPEFKYNLRFGYDRSSRDMSCVQGIPGRMCGYYEHEKPIIFMRESAIDEYERVLDIDNEYINPSETASTSLSGATKKTIPFIPCEMIEPSIDISKHIDSHMSNEKILNDLGYTNRDSLSNQHLKSARINTNESSKFKSQWENSEKDNPNYYYISNTYRGVKDYCVFLDRKEKVARIVKKTGDKEMIEVPHHKSKEVNNSLWGGSDFNKENK
jgi:hypothetical protein